MLALYSNFHLGVSHVFPTDFVQSFYTLAINNILLEFSTSATSVQNIK